MPVEGCKVKKSLLDAVGKFQINFFARRFFLIIIDTHTINTFDYGYNLGQKALSSNLKVAHAPRMISLENYFNQIIYFANFKNVIFYVNENILKEIYL